MAHEIIRSIPLPVFECKHAGRTVNRENGKDEEDDDDAPDHPVAFHVFIYKRDHAIQY
jgi:hypothetical protein